MAGSDLDLETMLAQLSNCVVTGKRIVLFDENTAPLGRIHMFAARSLRVPYAVDKMLVVIGVGVRHLLPNKL